MRTYDIPLRFDTNRMIWASRGLPTLDQDRLRVIDNMSVTTGSVSWCGRVELRAQEGSITNPYDRYPVNEWAIIAHPATRIDALKEILRGSVVYSTPDGTDIEVRLSDGTDDRYWDGSAWAVAGVSDWNTVSVLETNLSAWTSQLIGFSARLRSTAGKVTPVLFGFDLHIRIEFEPSSDVDSIGGSWVEDALLRGFCQSLKDDVEVYRVDEFAAPDGGGGEFDELDYSEGVGRTTVPVEEVLAVYNLDTDPHRRSALSGTWDAGAKTYGLDAPVTAGTILASRYRVGFVTAMESEGDLFAKTLPAILVEGVVQDESVWWSEPSRIIDTVAEKAYMIPAPEEAVFEFELNVLDVDRFAAMEVASAIRDWIGSGKRVRSDGSGRAFDVFPVGSTSYSGERGGIPEVTTRYRATGVLVYHRAEEEHPLFLEAQLDTTAILVTT